MAKIMRFCVTSLAAPTVFATTLDKAVKMAAGMPGGEVAIYELRQTVSRFGEFSITEPKKQVKPRAKKVAVEVKKTPASKRAVKTAAAKPVVKKTPPPKKTAAVEDGRELV